MTGRAKRNQIVEAIGYLPRLVGREPVAQAGIGDERAERYAVVDVVLRGQPGRETGLSG